MGEDFKWLLKRGLVLILMDIIIELVDSIFRDSADVHSKAVKFINGNQK